MPKANNYQKDLEKHHRKQELRKAKKKNQPHQAKQKSRKKDWKNFQEDWDDFDHEEFEAIIPKAEKERRKETEETMREKMTSSSAPSQGTTPSTAYTEGLVVEITAGQSRVNMNGEIIPCTLRGKLKDQDSIYANALAVGDRVKFSKNGEQGVIEAVLPRKSVLARPYNVLKGKGRGKQQIVAANIDQILIVASWKKPHFWPELVDRYLIAANRNDLEAIICVNKVDLIVDPEEFDNALAPYRNLAYQVISTSATTGVGLKNLKELLDNKSTVLAGLSGVGKSSLLTAIHPELDLKALSIGKRGKNRNQGRHTTTMATMYTLDKNTSLIDTPGIRQFGLAGLEPSELASYYPEMTELALSCQYPNCSHIHEPNCAVQNGLKDGRMAETRYENYTKILESLEGL